MNKYKPKIYIKKGKKPGKRVAIFCGIHGNEKAGIVTVDYIRKNIEIERGELVLVYANPPAIEKNVRMINKNLNRNFIKKRKLETYEDYIADELMNILDSCHALLDLHSYRAKKDAKPFLIVDRSYFDVVKNMDFEIIISGFSKIEKGATDGYMHNKNKIGICAELGSLYYPEEFVNLGIKTSLQFLKYFNLINTDTTCTKQKQKRMEAYLIYRKKHYDFSFIKNYNNFDRVKKSDIIAIENGGKIIAPFDGYIIFPNKTNNVGVEVFILTKSIL
jgi:succinylglutamate desuccinylase